MKKCLKIVQTYIKAQLSIFILKNKFLAKYFFEEDYHIRWILRQLRKNEEKIFIINFCFYREIGKIDAIKPECWANDFPPLYEDRKINKNNKYGRNKQFGWALTTCA